MMTRRVFTALPKLMLITYWHNRAIFIPLFGPVVKPNAKSEFGNELQQFVRLLSPDIDFAKTERQWFGEEQGYEHTGIGPGKSA